MPVNFLLKRSTTASKRPTAAQLNIGELSLNYDADTAGVFFEDSAGSVRKVGPTGVSATAPNSTPTGQAGNSVGEMWLDTSVTPNALRIWNGSAWAAASTGSYTESATAPATPSIGDRWLDTDVGILYSYVNDVSGDQWVELGAPGFSPQGSGDVVAASNNAFTGANIFTNTTGQIFQPATAQDGILLRGRAGGTSSFTVELVPTTLSASRTITLADGNTSLQAGTMATTGGTLAQFAITTSSQLAGVISNETGSGALVFATSPTLTTPILGVAGATSVNKVAITAPLTSATLTIADGKTLTASNTLTFTGTDASSVGFGTGGTIAYTADNLSVFAATTSSQLAGVISDETGSGVLVFGTSPSFTTSTTLANQASARFAEASVNGTNFVGFQAPASIVTDLTWTLPSADGTNRQVLQTNGSGVLSFATAAGVLRATFFADASVIWTNMPAAATIFLGNTSFIQKVDLTNYTECRLLVNKTAVAGAASSILRLEFSTTYTQTTTSYTQIGTAAASVTVNVANDYRDSGFQTLVSGAKANVFITIIGSGGDGALDPAFGQIVAEFR